MKILFKRHLNSIVRRDSQFSFSKFIRMMSRMNIVILMIGIVSLSNSKISATISWIIHISSGIAVSRMAWLLERRLRACRWMSIMRMV